MKADNKKQLTLQDKMVKMLRKDAELFEHISKQAGGISALDARADLIYKLIEEVNK